MPSLKLAFDLALTAALDYGFEIEPDEHPKIGPTGEWEIAGAAYAVTEWQRNRGHRIETLITAVAANDMVSLLDRAIASLSPDRRARVEKVYTPFTKALLHRFVEQRKREKLNGKRRPPPPRSTSKQHA